ncbi:MAG: GNAT family N-acetyltransferase [Phycisphaeraceae bacterium]|nr:GNAT family N-acetyltransferase [Phycisphaeraceae bacterium]
MDYYVEIGCGDDANPAKLLKGLLGWKRQDLWIGLFMLEGKPAGFVILEVDRTTRTGWGFIGEFYVAPEFRRRGVGTKGWQRSKAILQASGCRDIWLAAHPASEDFWRSCGLVEAADRKGDQKVFMLAAIEPSSIVPPAEIAGECDLTSLGLNREQITRIELLHRRKINWIYRLWCGDRSWILKWIVQPQRSSEIAFYRLLSECGVPVLKHRIGDRALLLEDVEHSAQWRLAREADAEKGETGRAVATWYRTLHAVGRQLVERKDSRLAGLSWEFAPLSAEVVHSIGDTLGLSDQPGWSLAERHVQELVAKACQRPMTLSYNDFHWSNLALARSPAATVPGIVFDYHLAGIGLAYSDWRNVLSCLKADAADAFKETYGPVDPLDECLDRPLALIHALQMVAESPVRPTWAQPLIDQVHDGRLERFIREAMAQV